MANPIDNKIAAITFTFNRPADTNAYVANDAISDSTSSPSDFSFIGAGRSLGQNILINSAVVSVDDVSASPEFSLLLFREQPTAINDNSPVDVSSSLDNFIQIPINENAQDATSIYNVQSLIDNWIFPMPSTLQDIPFLLVSANAHTPASASQYKVTINVIRI